MPGFFALAAEVPILRAAWFPHRLVRSQRLRTPCADRLGERTKRQRLGRVIVTPRLASNASWQSRPHVAEPGPRTPASGFSAHRSSGPHAPSTDSTLLGGSIKDQLVKVESITEGPAPAFRPLPARGTLLRGQLTTSPVPGCWPRPSLDSAPRGALRPFLGHSAKMPRIRFYNRRFTSRAPMSKHHLWRPSAERRGKPADVRLEIALWSAARAERCVFLGRRRTILRSSGLQQLRA
jgi:hypothetical protein